MDTKDCKMNRCKSYLPTLSENDYCVHGAKTIGDFDKVKRKINKDECETCPNFKSKYIEFPIVVEEIEYGDFEPWNNNICLAKVRIASDKNKRTWLALYLGNFPHMPYVNYSDKTKKLKFGMATNPCLYVPALGRIVWGDESWWSRIESKDDLKDITDSDIDSQWYMQLLDCLNEESAEDERTD